MPPETAGGKEKEVEESGKKSCERDWRFARRMTFRPKTEDNV